MKKFDVYLGLGSNLGNRELYLKEALRQLNNIVEIDKISPIYETVPKYITNQPKFLNLVIKVNTRIIPMELLTHLKLIEANVGRIPTKVRYGPRKIDLDILIFDKLIIKKTILNIPHPLMSEREFVLRPLADIAGKLVHPQLNKSINQLLAELKGEQEVKICKLIDLNDFIIAQQ